MEDALDVGEWALYVYQGAVGGGGADGQAVAREEPHSRVVLSLAGAETVGELRHRNIVAETRTGRIGDLGQKTVEARLVAQLERDSEHHRPGRIGQPGQHRRMAAHRRRHVKGGDREERRMGRGGRGDHERQQCPHGTARQDRPFHLNSPARLSGHGSR